MSLEDIQTRYEEAPKGGSWNKYPILTLKANDVANARLLGTGLTPDPLTDAGAFHQVQLISKRTNKPYGKKIFCTRSFDKEAGCEYCSGMHGQDAQKSSTTIGLWMWCYYIVRANQHPEADKNPSLAYAKESLPDGRQVFMEKVDGPMVWERGPGKDGEFINQLKLLRDLLGAMNKCDVTITRRGSGMNDTRYITEPVTSTINKEMSAAQKAVITDLPTIKEIFGGAEWPRSANADTGVSIADLIAAKSESETEESVF